MAQLALFFIAIFCFTVGCRANCGQVFEYGVTDKEKQEILNVHNKIRSLIVSGTLPGQPKGKNLKVMGWDNFLASEAQKIANTCVFKHVPVKDDRFYVGQNLAGWSGTGKSMGLNATYMVNMWLNEYPKFKYPNYTPGAGHYSQAIWADTQYIGCGFIHYRKTPQDWYDKLFVCNYGPGGNVIGVPPYEI